MDHLKGVSTAPVADPIVSGWPASRSWKPSRWFPGSLIRGKVIDRLKIAWRESLSRLEWYCFAYCNPGATNVTVCEPGRPGEPEQASTVCCLCKAPSPGTTGEGAFFVCRCPYRLVHPTPPPHFDGLVADQKQGKLPSEGSYFLGQSGPGDSPARKKHPED